MTNDAINDLSNAMTAYVLALKRAPTAPEIKNFITQFIRARKNGKLMAR